MGRRGRGGLAPDVAASIALGSMASIGAKDMQLRTAERPVIVAEMALVAPGRVDLLAALIERERKHGPERFKDWPPTVGVMMLLEATRRVMLGEVALVGPDGERVEQVRVDKLDGSGARSLLRLTHYSQWTADCRTVKELAGYVDLAQLREEKPDGS
jgi:hypothetical protein